MFYKFSERARRVVAHAHREAYAHNNEYIGTAHLLLGLIHDTDVARMLQVLGADARVIHRHIDATIGPACRAAARDLPITAQARKALERSMSEAQRRGHDVVDAEHILYGLIEETNCAAAKALRAARAEPARILQQIFLIWSPPNLGGQVAPLKRRPPRARQ